MRETSETRSNLLTEERNAEGRDNNSLIDTSRKQSHKQSGMDTADQQDEWTHDWAVVAQVLDRFFFFIYIFVLAIVTLFFLIQPLQSDSARYDKYKAVYSHNDGGDS